MRQSQLELRLWPSQSTLPRTHPTTPSRAPRPSDLRTLDSGAFSEGARRTVGVDFLERVLPVPALGEDARLFCWDTAGQGCFDALARSYCRGVGGGRAACLGGCACTIVVGSLEHALNPAGLVLITAARPLTPF
jgi:hypothetical protein